MTCWDAMARPQPSTHSWDQAHRRPTIEETLTDAEAAILVTEWPELTTTDWTAARQAMNGTAPVLYNGRNHLDPNTMPCKLPDTPSSASDAPPSSRPKLRADAHLRHPNHTSCLLGPV
ncbi:UDP binding domain-containing protein [Streptomyces sp. NPDC056982]|uniref:UDP binding domain-containing protein n=1 Tax=Streptomyces sp. NPDC056982 TaxID=3345986 RepID=UPI0036316CBE